MQTGATPSDETYTHLQVTPASPDISTVRTQNHQPLYDCDEFFALTWHANSITPVLKCCPPSSRSKLESAIRSSSGAASLAVPSLCVSQSLYLNDTGQELRSLGTPMEGANGRLPIAEFGLNRPDSAAEILVTPELDPILSIIQLPRILRPRPPLSPQRSMLDDIPVIDLALLLVNPNRKPKQRRRPHHRHT